VKNENSYSFLSVSGYVTDTSSGETLIGANIVLSSDEGIGVSTNTYGFYSMTLNQGEHQLKCSYLGYEDQVVLINVTADKELNFGMNEGISIEEVVISAEAEEADKNVESTEMGTIEVPMAQIKKLPFYLLVKGMQAFMLEVEAQIKT